MKLAHVPKWAKWALNEFRSHVFEEKHALVITFEEGLWNLTSENVKKTEACWNMPKKVYQSSWKFLCNTQTLAFSECLTFPV